MKRSPMLALGVMLALPCRPVAASLVEDHVRLADDAEARERWKDAANEITRALSWNELQPSLSAADRDRLLSRRRAAQEKWEESRPVPTPTPVPEPPKRRVRAATAPPSPDAEIDVARILKKADGARRAGRLETALRLYRVAARLPGGDAAAARVTELERALAD